MNTKATTNIPEQDTRHHPPTTQDPNNLTQSPEFKCQGTEGAEEIGEGVEAGGNGNNLNEKFNALLKKIEN